jgi:hypothetical protein
MFCVKILAQKNVLMQRREIRECRWRGESERKQGGKRDRKLRIQEEQEKKRKVRRKGKEEKREE